MIKDVRPWGEFEVIYADESYWTKILWIHPGQATSLQKHLWRDEFWTPMTGGVQATIGLQTIDLTPWVGYTVPRGTPHRLYNTSHETAVLIEIATGYPSETDIIRLQDLYGRV